MIYFFLIFWGLIIAVSLTILIYDLIKKNPHLKPLMKWVWILTILYSGPIGLAIYFYSGRKQIKRDDIWRRSFRSVSHCYSGCGLGEIVGIVITVGLLALNNIWVISLTFLLAYTAGFIMTAGPLIQEGVGFKTAIKDAFYSETLSITVMEVVAISVDLFIAGDATIGEPLFWFSLIISLSIGLLAAYPVNVWLIKKGIKEGIEKQNNFFTAEDLHSNLKNPKISLATIYRHLKKLRDSNHIYFYECDGKHIYSLEKKSHCHFICEETGKVIHFDLDSLDFIKKKIPGSITSFQLEVRGICENCKAGHKK